MKRSCLLLVILLILSTLLSLYGARIFRGKIDAAWDDFKASHDDPADYDRIDLFPISNTYTNIPTFTNVSTNIFIYTNTTELPSPFSNLTLIDSVDCSTSGASHNFTDFPSGWSEVQSLSGRNARVLPNTAWDARYMVYRMGQGMGLAAGNAYVLEVDYPEDLPRSMLIINLGCETTIGLHTGPTVGDALHPPYVVANAESLNLPLSGNYRTWRMFFHLHDRYPALKKSRGNEYTRNHTPADGFNVVIAQFGLDQAPLSAGAAVSEIRLYQAPDYNTYRMNINFPGGQPHRHLFFREEMSDNVISSTSSSVRGVITRNNWYIYKMRLMKFLGMNTFSKDLLEFGHNQGWDSSKYGWSWVNASSFPQTWSDIVSELNTYQLNALPFYEYTGGIGSTGLGSEKRCLTLGGQSDYTHVSWTETANADLTDPDTWTDLRKMLEITIVDEKANANFVGAWIRTRTSALPVSFSDQCLNLFQWEANGGIATTRTELINDPSLYTRYYEWWLLKRKAFLNTARDYLRGQGIYNNNAVVLYTTDHTEGGLSYPYSDDTMICDGTSSLWTTIFNPRMDLADALSSYRQYVTMTSPVATWGTWEWQHSAPQCDPWNYTNNEGVMLTWSFNRAYTVGEANSLDSFDTPSGMAMIRHYNLNEHAMESGGDIEILGYFVADFELAGPFCMMAEALALANGDPTFIGYLASSSFSRGFPAYVREFNANFLALPGLASIRMDHLSDKTGLAVRLIETEGSTYLALINITPYDLKKAKVHFPRPGRVTDAGHDRLLSTYADSIQLDMYPYQLKTLRIDPVLITRR